MRALDKLRYAEDFLKKSNFEDSYREAEIIITTCLGIDRTVLYRDNPVIKKYQDDKINKFLERRKNREPLQYIIGNVDFYGLKIKVGRGVLIPRPETELLVEKAIKTVKRDAMNVMYILDLCTGSGCLALALAKEFPKAEAYGTDISEIAIRYSRKNAKINRINNVYFFKGNLFEPIRKYLKSHISNLKFDIIISNPPYIRRDDIKNLQSEIRDWEPVEALDGGKEGLDYYKIIIPEARFYLKQRGYLILEIGQHQFSEVRRIVEEVGFLEISMIKDYSGIERIFIARN